jgi:hypothetical protein
MFNPCLADEYAGYLAAARATAMALSRAIGQLEAVPDLGTAAAATTFDSPGTNRLKRDVTEIGTGLADATGRVNELIGYLNGLAAKYEAWHARAVEIQQNGGKP